jgi:hypothetical protein
MLNLQRRWNTEAVDQAEGQLVEHGAQPLEENKRMKMRIDDVIDFQVSFEGLPSIWMVRTTPFSDPAFNCSANSGRLSFCSVLKFVDTLYGSGRTLSFVVNSYGHIYVYSVKWLNFIVHAQVYCTLL